MASLKHKGAHCESTLLVCSSQNFHRQKEKKVATYTTKSIDEKGVQNSQKQLIAHKNSKEQVPKHKRTKMILCILKLAQGSQNDTNKVQRHDKGEKLAIRVEPKPEQNPPTNLLLRLSVPLDHGLGRSIVGRRTFPAGRPGEGERGRETLVDGRVGG